MVRFTRDRSESNHRAERQQTAERCARSRPVRAEHAGTIWLSGGRGKDGVWPCWAAIA